MGFEKPKAKQGVRREERFAGKPAAPAGGSTADKPAQESCCSPAEQRACCELEDKAACCGASSGGSCGCR